MVEARVALAAACLLLAGCGGERVARVIDGDTLVLDSGERVRLLGIDAPERGEPGADAATSALREMAAGRRVRLERDGRDRWGRTLARVRAGGKDASGELLARGLVKPRGRRKPKPKPKAEGEDPCER